MLDFLGLPETIFVHTQNICCIKIFSEKKLYILFRKEIVMQINFWSVHNKSSITVLCIGKLRNNRIIENIEIW